MESYFENNNGNNIKATILRFEVMLKNKEEIFFDVDDIETIIDYYFDYNKTKFAKKAIDLGLNQHPNNTTLLIKRAQYYAIAHQPNKALKILSDIENVEPFNIDVILTKAQIYTQLKQAAHAISFYKKALTLTDDSYEIDNIKLSIVYELQQQNKIKEAITLLKEILHVNPKNESALYELAFCYNLINANKTAIKYFSSFIDKHPYSYACWFNLGIAYGNTQQFEEAIKAYDFAATINPEFVTALFNKGTALAELEKYAEAIETFKEIACNDEEDVVTLFYIAECYEELDDYKNALQFYKKTIKLDSEYAVGWAGIAICEDALENYDAALYAIKKASYFDQNNSDFWYIEGDILYNLGWYEEASLCYLQVVKMHPQNEEAWVDLCESVKSFNGTKVAIEYAEKGMEIQPKNFLLSGRLISYLLIENKIEKATPYLHQLLTEDIAAFEELVDFYPAILLVQEFKDIIGKYYDKKF